MAYERHPESTEIVDEDADQTLDEIEKSLIEARDRIDEICLMRRAGPKGWALVGACKWAPSPPTEGDEDARLTAEDIPKLASEILAAANDDAEQHGKRRRYMVQLRLAPRASTAKPKIEQAYQFVLDPASYSMHPAKGEVLAGAEMSRKIASDSHKRFMDISGANVEMAQKIVELVGRVSENSKSTEAEWAFRTEMARMAHEHETSKIDAELSAQTREHVADIFKTFMSTMGPQLLSWLSQKSAGGGAGMDPETMVGPYAKRLATILGKGDSDKLREAFGDDLWDTVQSAARADSDEGFRGLMDRLKKQLERLSAERQAALLQQVNEAIGEPNMASLAALLMEVGVLGQ